MHRRIATASHASAARAPTHSADQWNVGEENTSCMSTTQVCNCSMAMSAGGVCVVLSLTVSFRMGKTERTCTAPFDREDDVIAALRLTYQVVGFSNRFKTHGAGRGHKGATRRQWAHAISALVCVLVDSNPQRESQVGLSATLARLSMLPSRLTRDAGRLWQSGRT